MQPSLTAAAAVQGVPKEQQRGSVPLLLQALPFCISCAAAFPHSTFRDPKLYHRATQCAPGSACFPKKAF